MQTRTSPWDYEKRILIVSQLVRLCAVCGGNTSPRPADNRRACLSCGSTVSVEVWEHMADTFRRGLMELEMQKAQEWIDALAAQADELRGALRVVSVLKGDEVGS